MRLFGTTAAALALGALCVSACVGDAPAVATGAADAGPRADATMDKGSPPDGSAPQDAAVFDAAPSDAAEDAGSDGSVPDAKVDSGADAGSFLPSDLGASLVVWLDGSRSVAVDASNNVSTWGDSSGNGNAATASGVASPIRMAGALNGHDALVFNGSANYLTIADSATLQWAQADYAIFLVARYSNAAAALSAAQFWGKITSATPASGAQFFCSNLGGAFLESAASRLGTNVLDGTHLFNDNVWRVYATRRFANTSLEIRVNGAVEATKTIGVVDVSATGSPAYIGGANAGGTPGLFMIGSIAEIVAVTGALSDTNLAKVEAYLRARYGI